MITTNTKGAKLHAAMTGVQALLRGATVRRWILKRKKNNYYKKKKKHKYRRWKYFLEINLKKKVIIKQCTEFSRNKNVICGCHDEFH